DHDHKDEKDHDHDHHGVDPHYWLDPANAQIMANEILYTMIELLPEFEMQLRNNAAPLLRDLEELDRVLAERTAKLAQRRIVTGGHFAFGYFTEKYDLEAISPFENLSPDAEPSPQKLAEIVDYVRDHEVKVIFHEELLDPKIAQMIATETGAKMLQLHAAHNVSKEELQHGVTYVQIMIQNMKNLEEGLGVK
ncbi:MAG: zinc ABC transporter substrate-binding protein, partial [Bacillota bacterium]|nr:zinc ABC transporter substrate-binding protein [Bacillota bacterium]